MIALENYTIRFEHRGRGGSPDRSKERITEEANMIIALEQVVFILGLVVWVLVFSSKKW